MTCKDFFFSFGTSRQEINNVFNNDFYIRILVSERRNINIQTFISLYDCEH